jgi:hypothetical protein
MTNSMMASKCSSVATHFEGLADVPVQYKVHCPMHHVQGYTRSHWTSPLGNYLLRIAPAAARATANKTTMNKCTHFAGYFDSRGSAPVRYRAHHLIEEVQGFTRSHWTPPLGVLSKEHSKD